MGKWGSAQTRPPRGPQWTPSEREFIAWALVIFIVFACWAGGCL